MALAGFLALVAGGAGAADPAQAPTFSVTSLTGDPIVLAELVADGPVLLDFWATWCKPCVRSLGEIQAFHERFSERGLRVVGISIDGPRNYARVRPFATRLSLTFPIVLDAGGDLQRDYRVTLVPTAVLISPSGAIERVQQGHREGDSHALEAAIVALLP